MNRLRQQLGLGTSSHQRPLKSSSGVSMKNLLSWQGPLIVML